MILSCLCDAALARGGSLFAEIGNKHIDPVTKAP